MILRLLPPVYGGPARAAALFAEDAFWRDLAAFTWNLKTFEGRAEISDMLTATLAHVQPMGWKITSGREPAEAGGPASPPRSTACRRSTTAADQARPLASPRPGRRCCPCCAGLPRGRKITFLRDQPREPPA
jgi:hypothetical protein